MIHLVPMSYKKTRILIMSSTRLFCYYEVNCHSIIFHVNLEADLIDIGHLDPLERHKGRSNTAHYGYINHRYSSFKVSSILLIFLH